MILKFPDKFTDFPAHTQAYQLVTCREALDSDRGLSRKQTQGGSQHEA